MTRRQGDGPVRFFVFLCVLFILTLIVLYVMGASRTPQTRVIEQEIDLNAPQPNP